MLIVYACRIFFVNSNLENPAFEPFHGHKIQEIVHLNLRQVQAQISDSLAIMDGLDAIRKGPA
jgi:hypothetical protein